MRSAKRSAAVYVTRGWRSRPRRPKKAESLNAPFFKLWSMLRPNLRSIFRDEWELLPFAAVCLARGWEVRWSTELVLSLIHI